MPQPRQMPLYFIVEDRAIRAMLIRHAALAPDISDTGLDFLIGRLREQHMRRHDVTRPSAPAELIQPERSDSDNAA